MEAGVSSKATMEAATTTVSATTSRGKGLRVKREEETGCVGECFTYFRVLLLYPGDAIVKEEYS